MLLSRKMTPYSSVPYTAIPSNVSPRDIVEEATLLANQNFVNTLANVTSQFTLPSVDMLASGCAIVGGWHIDCHPVTTFAKGHLKACYPYNMATTIARQYVQWLKMRGITSIYCCPVWYEAFLDYCVSLEIKLT